MIPRALTDRLESGATTLCRCWRLTRADGRVMGFTDHDGRIAFDGTVFSASEGMTAGALEQTTGLSVDNGMAEGALSGDGITEADIAAGRYDGAAVEAWLVDWTDVDLRTVIFRGTLGEIERSGGAFRAELRGLAEALNRPLGRTYQGPCDAVLGDRGCGVDLGDPRFAMTASALSVDGGGRIVLPDAGRQEAGWFERGTLTVLGGPAAGLMGVVQMDRVSAGKRTVVLWQSIRGGISAGDRVRLTAGCDKRIETCRDKFANTINFRGFPHMPSEDWLMAYPVKGGGR